MVSGSVTRSEARVRLDLSERPLDRDLYQKDRTVRSVLRVGTQSRFVRTLVPLRPRQTGVLVRTRRLGCDARRPLPPVPGPTRSPVPDLRTPLCSSRFRGRSNSDCSPRDPLSILSIRRNHRWVSGRTRSSDPGVPIDSSVQTRGKGGVLEDFVCGLLVGLVGEDDLRVAL